MERSQGQVSSSALSHTSSGRGAEERQRCKSASGIGCFCLARWDAAALQGDAADALTAAEQQTQQQLFLFGLNEKVEIGRFLPRLD